MTGEEKKRVLVADDDTAVLKLLAKVVELEGHECTAVASGEEALALVEGREFDLLVTDKNMPGMDGIELVRLCRELRPGMAAMVITAFGSAGSALAAASQGIVDYILKPVDLTTLRMRLRRALRHGGGENPLAAGDQDPEPVFTGPPFAVVVVEPDETVREALVAALTSLGHRTWAFAGEDEARAQIPTTDFDLLVAHPETLRAHPEWLAGGRFAAVLMPSRDLDRVIAGIELGARAVLGPPFDDNSLRTLLGALLRELATERLRRRH